MNKLLGKVPPQTLQNQANSAVWGPYHWSKNHYTHTTFIVGELILQLHTHQLHSFNCGGINLCNACVSLVSACLASMISQNGNYTTAMLREFISNCTHTSYTSIIVGELILQTRAPWTEVELAQMNESCLAGVQKVFWPEGPRVSQKSLAPVQTRFAPVQPHVAPVQRAFCSYFRKDLLRPLQSTLGQIS